jgi:MFS family permease
VLCGAIVLVDTIFFAALTPLLPHFADEFGLSKTAAGILTAAYAAGGVACAIPAGWFASRVGVKAAVLLGLALMIATSIAFGFATSAWALIAARFGQGVGSSLSWNGSLAWLIAGTARERRGQVIGNSMAAAVGGALLGPVLGGIASLVGTAPAFSAVAVLGFVLAAWAWATPAEKPESPQPLRMMLAALATPRVAGGLWLITLAALLFGGLVEGTSTRGLDPSVFPPQLAGNLTLMIQALVLLFVGADVLILYLWNVRRRIFGRRAEPRAAAAEAA